MTGIIGIFCSVTSYVLLAPVAIVASLVTGSGNAAHSLGRLWAGITLSCTGVRVQTTGTEHIPRETPCIFAANHASQYDIPVLYKALPVQFRFLVKKELFRVPLLGLAMKRAGYIPIDRSGGKAALLSLRKAADAIRAGTSIVVFPEGTRSRDGRLQPIKPGAVVLALKSRCPVVPVAISGTHRVLPKGRLGARPGRVRVRIGPPIKTEEDGAVRSKEEVSRELYTAICSMLEMENRPPGGRCA